MLRERLLQPRWLVYPVVLWGIALAALPQPAEAAPLPPTRDGGAGADLEMVRALLESRIVRERLLALGASPAAAAATLDRLTPEERTELAARARELEAGGDAVAILAIAIILALVVILILELMGRRVISRP